jgi:hypothetical protein
MTTTLAPASNGRARRSLNDSIARLDEMIDGLSEAIPETIRDTLKEALGAALASAVADGVKAAVVQVMGGPAFLAALRGPARPRSATLRDRVRRLVAQARQATACWVTTIGARLDCNARAVVDRVTGLRAMGRSLWAARKPALVTIAVGLAATTLAVLAPNWVGTALSGIGGAVTAAAVQGWLWVRRAVRPLLAA